MKKAIQRLVRADDGTVRIIYIDAETLRELPSLEGYQVINQSSNYWEPVKDVKDPNTPSETVTSDHLNKYLDKSGDKFEDKSFARKEVQRTIDDAKNVSSYAPSRSTSQPQQVQAQTESSTSSRPASDPVSNDITVTSQMGGGLGIGGRISGSLNTDTGKVSSRPQKELGLERLAYEVSKAPYSEERKGMAALIGNYGSHRPNPPSSQIREIVQRAAYDTFGPGYTVVGTSGTEAPGQKQWGSNRHGTGKAIDAHIVGPDGKPVTDKGKLHDFAMKTAELGATSFGYGPEYMGPASMHVDATDPKSWRGQDSGWGSIGNQWQEELGFARQLPNDYKDNIPTPTPRPTQNGLISTVQMSEPKETSFAKKEIDKAVQAPSNYEQSQTNPLGKFTGVTASAPGYTGIVGADAKEYGLYGDAATRNNNPGNLGTNSWSGAIGTSNVDKDHSFAVYSTPEEGANAKASLLGGSKYRDLSVYNAMHLYAPPEDNNPTQAYIDHIVKETGVRPTTKLSDMSETEFGNMLDAISSFESPQKSVDVKDSLGRHIGSYSNGQLTRDPSAEGYYTDRGSLMDTPSETSGIGRGSGRGDSFGYSGRTGSSDSPSERGGRFGGSGLGYSGYGGLDSPSERDGRFGGLGLGSRTSTSDKEKDRSLDKDKDKPDHRNGGRMTD